jgi:hypothetical protein
VGGEKEEVINEGRVGERKGGISGWEGSEGGREVSERGRGLFVFFAFFQ